MKGCHVTNQSISCKKAKERAAEKKFRSILPKMQGTAAVASASADETKSDSTEFLTLASAEGSLLSSSSRSSPVIDSSSPAEEKFEEDGEYALSSLSLPSRKTTIQSSCCSQSYTSSTELYGSENGASTNDSTTRNRSLRARPERGESVTTCRTYFSEGRKFYDDGYESSHASLDDRLDFSDLKVKERSEDIQRLHDAYNRVDSKGKAIIRTAAQAAKDDSVIPGRNKEEREKVLDTSMALIRGLSGTGKSTLVNQFIQDINDKSIATGGPTKPYFLSGKFDELASGDPYSAIVEAFSKFAQCLLLDLDDQGENDANEEIERIRISIHESLGDEAHVMASMVPGLKALILDPNANSNCNFPASDITTGASSENAWNRLKYIFQVFSNAISSPKRPIIMFLDDLQWSDSASLELIESLATDKNLHHFMLIGAYRSNEVSPGDELMTRIEAIRKVQDIKEIELKNLSVGELNNFIADALKQEEDDRHRVVPLTEVIHRKTRGNIFFAVQMLEELQRKGVLIFSRLTFQWEWNVDDVSQLDDLLSDDVLVTVTSKISSTPELLQRALILMAYTRSTVDFETIRQLLELDGYPMKREKLEKLLEKAVFEGLLTNRMGSDNYSFAHDRIQQAAYGMVPVGKSREIFRLKMGYRLYNIVTSSESSDGKDWLFFAAADHLNSVALQVNIEEKDPLFLTKVNLDAGNRAASIAAFETASKFLSLAMRSLVQQVRDPWNVEYDLALKVYGGIVVAELSQGHFDIGRGIADRVLEHARTIEDKLPIQLALAKALGRENRQHESYKLSIASLRELGYFPKRSIFVKANLGRDFLYVKRYLKAHSDQEILSMPHVTDKRLIVIMEMLFSFGLQAHFRQKLPEFLGSILKQIRLTFQYGLFPGSASGMIGFCLFNQAINDQNMVERSVYLAREMAKKTKSKESGVFQAFMSAYYVLGWKDPHDEVIDVCISGEKAGMEAGDFETANLCNVAHGCYIYVSGFPLEQVNRKFLDLADHVERYKLDVYDAVATQHGLVPKLLMGIVEVDFDELENFNFVKNDGSENYKVLYGCLARIQIGVFFENYELSEKMMAIFQPLLEIDESYPVLSSYLFFGALAYASLARKHRTNNKKKKAYLTKAQKMSKELGRLCKIRGMKCFHRHLIAEAHIRSVKTPGMAAFDFFEEAISAAVEGGNIHDAALGAQQASLALLNMTGSGISNTADAKFRPVDTLVEKSLTQAREWYLEWGAAGLVRFLEINYDMYLKPMEDNSSGRITFNPIKREGELGSTSTTVPRSVANRSQKDTASDDDVSVLSEAVSWNKEGPLADAKDAKNDLIDGILKDFDEIGWS